MTDPIMPRLARPKKTLNPGAPAVPATHARQRGFALLAVMVFIGLVAAVFVVRSLNADTLRTRQDQRTTEALALAKQALLAYATTDDNRPGSLPCPDIDGDGRSLPGIEYVGQGCASYIGRLPWALLRIPELRDGSGEQLWIAISPNFRDAGDITGNPGFINPDTAPQLSIIQLPGEALVAIVFAPGPVLPGQTRAGASATILSNYLDGVNATPTIAFSASPPGPAFNDRLLPVTRSDIVASAERRVAQEVARALNDYFVRFLYLPAAASFTNAECVSPGTTAGCVPEAGVLAGRLPANVPAPGTYSPATSGNPDALLRGDAADAAWFQHQRWREQALYIVSPECVGPPANNCAGGSLLVTGASGAPVAGARFVVIMGGVVGPGQQRNSSADKTQLANYIDSTALRNAASSLNSGVIPPSIPVPAGTVATASPR